MLKLFEEFGLDENTQSFTGHAMALQRDDSYLHRCHETLCAVFGPCSSLEGVVGVRAVYRT